MPNVFSGTGNLGDNPTLKTVSVNGEDKKVAELRVMFDEFKPDGDGGFKPNGGLWLNVSVWGKRAETAAALLRKGARVRVDGRLTEQQWTDKETGVERTAHSIVADDITLSLSRIESVTFKPKREYSEAEVAA